MSDKGDYQELVSSVSSKISRRQLLNVAVMIGATCLLLASAALFSLVSESFWQVLVYNMVKAALILSGLAWFVRIVYKMINAKIETVAPDLEVETKKEASKTKAPVSKTVKK